MIKIICVGKLKETYWVLAMNEYIKRLSKYTKIEIIEISDYNSDNINIIKLKEKELIEKHINNNDYIITLEIEGKQFDSNEFSNFIDKTLINNSNIIFIIGGSYGIHEDIKQRSSYALSFSKLTFPHQMFRVMLLEQIYRAFKIIKNESYHK